MTSFGSPSQGRRRYVARLRASLDFFIGRCHAAALLPEVIPLIEAGKLRPGELTTRTVDRENASEAYLEPAVKLVVRRD
jgi:hypothetical protein